MSKIPKRKGMWWMNEGAESRVRQLIEDSGSLLEVALAEACQAFANANKNKQGVRISTESVTYGKDTEQSPLRQIDQCVNLYKEFILDERTGVQLQVHLPIEAKYRKDVEIIGVPYPPNSYRPRFPFVGFIHGSQLSGTLQRVLPFETVPLLHPVFVEITDGNTPKCVHAENLLYNAASALYDFIGFDLHSEEEETAEEATIIDDLQLLKRFDQYLAEKRYAWWAVIYEWMKENLTQVLVDEFNRRLGRERIHYSIYAHIPVLCMNGALWEYSRGSFASIQALLTRVRVPRWPGELRRRLIKYTAEAPLLVTNPTWIAAVLAEALKWFLAIEESLKAADSALVDRWPIESAFYRAAVARAVQEYPEDRVRSDLDVFDWL